MNRQSLRITPIVLLALVFALISRGFGASTYEDLIEKSRTARVDGMLMESLLYADSAVQLIEQDSPLDSTKLIGAELRRASVLFDMGRREEARKVFGAYYSFDLSDSLRFWYAASYAAAFTATGNDDSALVIINDGLGATASFIGDSSYEYSDLLGVKSIIFAGLGEWDSVMTTSVKMLNLIPGIDDFTAEMAVSGLEQFEMSLMALKSTSYSELMELGNLIKAKIRPSDRWRYPLLIALIRFQEALAYDKQDSSELALVAFADADSMARLIKAPVIPCPLKWYYLDYSKLAEKMKMPDLATKMRKRHDALMEKCKH